MKTYTKSNKGLAFLREAKILFSFANSSPDAQAAFLVEQMQKAERRVYDAAGLTLENLDVLVVGPGQKMREMIYLGIKNRVIGIDLDVIVGAFSVRTNVEMLRVNGPMRTVKTLVRKQLGLDRRFEEGLKRHLKIDRIPAPNLMQMDASKMSFPDASFDFVYSFSVFEHMPEPGKVVDEIVRVLRPGGVCYISLHMYTSLTGCHDLQVFAHEFDPPHWPHLRPQLKSTVQPNAYLNEVRLPEWKQIFCERLPGVRFEFDSVSPNRRDDMRRAMAQLQADGELKD